MSTRNNVIWNEGLFIKPQHFQQQSRYSDYLLNQRIWATYRHAYGFTDLSINNEDLQYGRISVTSASCVMKDGSVLSIPQETRAPKTLEIADGVTNQIVYLSIPSEKDNIVNVTDNFNDDGGARLIQELVEVRDISDKNSDFTSIKVGQLRTRLMLEQEDRSSYSCLAICRLAEKNSDGSIRLDENFIPPISNLHASSVLERYLEEVINIMTKRSELIAQRIGQPGQSGVAEVSDFLMLQVMNRYSSWLNYIKNISVPHPEQIYAKLIEAVGELSTFSTARIAPDLMAYNHDHPSQCFRDLINHVRRILSEDRPAQAESLVIQEGRYGLRTIPVNDSSIFESSDFILAVKATLPLDQLHREILQKAKLSSIENISELVKLAMPGIQLIQLPVAPRQLPYHAGFTYFQLDNSVEFRRIMKGASGFGMHISGSLPDLEMEFWALRH